MSHTNQPYGKSKEFRGPAWLNEDAMLALLQAAGESSSVEELIENAGLSGKISPDSFRRFRNRAQHSNKEHALRIYIDLFDKNFSGEIHRGYLNLKNAVESAILRFNSKCECGADKETAATQCDECHRLQLQHSAELGKELSLARNGRHN